MPECRAVETAYGPLSWTCNRPEHDAATDPIHSCALDKVVRHQWVDE